MNGGVNGANETRVRISRLDNGLTVATELMPHLETAALGVWVKAGSRAERTAEHGIAHFLEHMAFKGTTNRSAQQIAEEIEAVGGDLNAVTGVESTAYYARVLKADVPLGIELLADIIQNARFDGEELVRERSVIAQEILAANDTPDDVVFDRMQALAFPDQPIGRSILGTIDTVEGFGADHLASFLGRNYSPQRMIVAAAGKVDHDEIAARVAEQFSIPRDGIVDPFEPARFSTGQELIERPIEQVHLILGFAGVGIGEPDIYAAQILSTLLGGGMSSRLFQEVRERRGLCYGIYAYHWSISDSGLFGVYAGTGPGEVAELADVVLDQLADVGGTISETELDRAKAQLKAGLLMSLESPSARIEQIARHLASFGRIIDPSELIARVEVVSTEDIRKLAERIFRTDRMVMAAVGPGRGLEKLAHLGSNSGQ